MYVHASRAKERLLFDFEGRVAITHPGDADVPPMSTMIGSGNKNDSDCFPTMTKHANPRHRRSDRHHYNIACESKRQEEVDQKEESSRR